MTMRVDVHRRRRIPFGTVRATLLLSLLWACSDATTPAGPRIESADPDPATPGAEVVLEGVGFGAGGHVGVGGRPVRVLDWDAERIAVELPGDIGGGPAQVVVVTGGRPSPPHTLGIAGPRAERLPPDRSLQPSPRRRDAGPEPTDAGPEPTDGGERPPDASLDLAAEFSQDPAGDGFVFVEGAGEPGSLVLTVRLTRDLWPNAWGIAFHLRYDRNLLRFVGAEPALDQRFHAAELEPGRLALGRILNPDGLVARLRFALLGRGEGRVDLVPRHRALRDRANEPLPGVRWAGGSVRVVRR